MAGVSRWVATRRFIDAARTRAIRDKGMADVSRWVATRRFIDAARARVRAENLPLRRLLTESDRRLSPLTDPLASDFGAHRWLRNDREPAYSEWLAWVLERLGTAERAFGVLGLAEVLPGCHLERPVRCRVEKRVGAGHPGRQGRIDVEVDLEGEAVVWLELKLGDADASDWKKHAGYWKSLKRRQSGLKSFAIMIATSGSRKEYGRFEFLSWRQLCLRLRHGALELLRGRDSVSAAMSLAFVGAVEQNLVDFPGNLRERIDEGQALWSSTAVAEHLRSWLHGGTHGPAPDG
jgi:hypothetical protein